LPAGREDDASGGRRLRLHAVIYALAYLALPLFGWRFASSLDSRLARLGFAFLCGALLLAAEAMLFSTIGIPWSAWALGLPLLVLGVRRGQAPATRSIPVVPALLCTIAILHFAFAIATTRSTAADYLLFWGTKGMLFAEARGIDPELLRSTYFTHGMVEYPPLVPIVQAWGVLFTGRMPWLTAAVMSAVWFAAAVPVVFTLLARAIGRDFGAIATAFWTVAMTNSLISSMSGGNAEAMLLAYASIAGAAILANDRRIAAIALAGAMLSKAEGFVIVGGLVIGLLIAERRLRALKLAIAPAVAIGLWVLYRWRHDLSSTFSRKPGPPVFHPETFDEVLPAMGVALPAGSWWIPWLFALVLIAIKPKRLAIPLLTAVGGSFAFFFYVYLQNPNNPAQQIGWTLPRISQPALSLLILAAAWASAPQRPQDAVTAA
jgi:hypothetical protein